MDAFFLLRTLAPMVVISTIVLAALVAAPVILYVVARWRADREGAADRQLGLKFALHYFSMSAFQLGLAGVTLLIYMLISPSTAEKGSGYRAAIGMIVPAGLVLALHLNFLKRTNDELVPGVRRLFWGYNMIVTGLVAFVALVLGFQALLAKGSSGGLGHLAGAMVVVYGTAWVIVGMKFGQLVLGGGTGTLAGGGSVLDVAAQPVVPTPPAQAQTGLPALGGGSYPPIESK